MKKKKKGRKLDLPKSRSSKRRYQKEQLIRRIKDSQKQAEGGGLSILKPDVDVTIWRPNDGSHIIDIIPYETGKMNVEGDKPGKVHYTFHYYIHKNVGPNNDWYICPARTWGDPCPICEHRAKLLDQGADYDTKIAPLNTKERNLYNVVCYDKDQEKKGVQLWDISFHYFEKHIVALSKKPARGGRSEKTIVFFDEEEGKSITFTIEPAKSKEDYPSYVGHSFDDRDYEIDEELLDAANCLDELVHKPTYDELEKAFWGTKGPGGREDEDDEDDDDDEPNWEMLIDDVDDCEDNEELQEFCDENDIDVKLKSSKKKFKANKKKVRAWLEEKSADDDDDDDDDDDYDDDDNDDDDEDDDDDDDEDDDEEEDTKSSKRKSKGKDKDKKGKKGKGKGKEKYTVDDIEEMNKRKLKKLIKKEKLDVDPDDAEDIDDLQDMVIEELGLDDD